MKRDQLISIFFIALLIFVVYQIFSIFSPFAQAIFWSAILAFAFYPLYDILKKTLKTHEVLTALTMTFLICLIVIPPVVILLVNATEQAIQLYQSTVLYIRNGNFEIIIEKIRVLPWTQKMEAGVFKWDIIKQTIESWILNSTRAFGNFTASQVGVITKNAFLVLLNVIAMIFLVFIFLKDGDKIYRFLYDIAPLEEVTKRHIFRHINTTFAAVIRGQVLTSLVQATLAGILYTALGLPVPLLFATATFITSLIPVVGASGTWIPIVVYLYFQQLYVKAIILFLIGTLVISMMDNILKPAIIGEKTKLPYFLLFFGILGGIKLYGIMGIFIAPVVLSLFFALVKIFQENYLANKS